MENQLRISIFIYTISEIILLCIVLFRNPSPRLKFHIHEILNGLYVYIPTQKSLKPMESFIPSISGFSLSGDAGI